MSAIYFLISSLSWKAWVIIGLIFIIFYKVFKTIFKITFYLLIFAAIAFGLLTIYQKLQQPNKIEGSSKYSLIVYYNDYV